MSDRAGPTFPIPSAPDDAGAPRSAAAAAGSAPRAPAGPRLERLEAPFAGDTALHASLGELLGTVAALHGSRVGVLVLRREDGGEPYVAACLGLAPERLRAAERLAGHVEAWGAALRDGRPMHVDDVEAADVPAAHREMARELGYRAVCVVPLATRGAEARGLVAVCFGSPHRPGTAESRLAERFVAQSAQLLAYARLYARSLAALAERRRIEETLRFVTEAGDLLSSSLEFEETLRRVAALATRSLADYCIVDVVEESGEVKRIEAAHRDPALMPVAKALLDFPPRPGDDRYGVPLVLRTGKPLLVERLTDETYHALAQDEEHYRLHVALHPRSAIVVPLVANGRVVGALTLARSEEGAPPYGENSLRAAEALAGRAGLAIANARLYRMAQEAVREREELVAVVGHDLRNPLNTIAMASSLLALDSLPEEKKLAQAAIIQRAVDQAGRLIRDLLDLTRIRAGALTVRPHPLNPVMLMEDALQLLHPLAEMHSVGLRVAPPGPLPRVAADRDRMLQVFSNLIGNALKFTPEGGQVVLRAEAGTGEVCFSVEDTGPGIAPEDLKMIFERFWQGSHTLHQGIGLGLSIAKGIVEAHHGRIWVESEVGVGTRFWFALPAEG